MKLHEKLAALLVLLSMVFGSGAVYADSDKFDAKVWQTDIKMPVTGVYGHWKGDKMGFASDDSSCTMLADITPEGQLILSGDQKDWSKLMSLINQIDYKKPGLVLSVLDPATGINKIYRDGIDATDSTKQHTQIDPAQVILFDGHIISYANNIGASTPADGQDSIYSAPARDVIEAHGYQVSWFENSLCIEKPVKKATSTPKEETQ